jgi:hypothetical protein
LVPEESAGWASPSSRGLRGVNALLGTEPLTPTRNTHQVSEMTDEQTRELMRTKRAIFAAQPHGVFTFGGACSGVTWGKGRFYHPARVPTAVANVVSK